MAIAWIIYGIATALDSGTIDNEVIIGVRRQNKSQEIIFKEVNTLVRLNARVQTAFMMLGGIIGSVLYFYVGYNIYLIAAGLAVLSILLVIRWFTLSSDKSKLSENNHDKLDNKLSRIKTGTMEVLQAAWFDLKTSKRLRIFMLILCLNQLFFQTHFQLWQGYFLARGISEQKLSIFYILFQIISIIVSFISVDRIRNSTGIIMRIAGASLVISSIILLFVLNNFWILPFYLLFVGIFWIILNDVNSRLRTQITEQALSTMTSLSSALSRIGAIVSLIICSITLNYISVTTLVPIMFSLSVILTAGGLFYLVKSVKS